MRISIILILQTILLFKFEKSSSHAPPSTFSPNFVYVRPQKIKINHTFRQIRVCYRRILPVLLSHHSIELVENKYYYFIPPWSALCGRVFFWVSSSIFLNSLDNTVRYRACPQNSHIELKVVYCTTVTLVATVTLLWLIVVVVTATVSVVGNM